MSAKFRDRYLGVCRFQRPDVTFENYCCCVNTLGEATGLVKLNL